MRGKALRSIILAFALASAIVPAAFAANVTTDRLELLSHGGIDPDSGLFTVDSRLYFSLSFAGGDKFGGLLKLDFLSGEIGSDLSQLQNPLPATATLPEAIDRLNIPGLRFRTVALTTRNLFGLPVEATYFIGNFENFCSGDDFVPLFGAAPFATTLRGPLVYPEGVGGDPNLFYDGIHTVYGTGVRFGYVKSTQAVYLYAYQDSDLGPGQWSTDIRGLLDVNRVKFEIFGGASIIPESGWGLYRAGLLFHYAPGAVGEFYAQLGAPRIDPSTGISIDDFFFLFEPRVNFSPGSLAITVFYHPAFYRQKKTNENGSLDLAANLKFGNLHSTGVQGGVEGLFAFRTKAGESPLAVDIAPYYSVISSGLEWNFKLDLRVFPVPDTWYAMFKPFIGAKTSF